MNLFTGGDSVDGAVDLTEDEDDQMSNESDDEVTGTGRWEMEVAKVYERTLVDIGQYLERPGV